MGVLGLYVGFAFSTAWSAGWFLSVGMSPIPGKDVVSKSSGFAEWWCIGSMRAFLI